MLTFINVGKALKPFGKEGMLKCRIRPEFLQEILNVHAIFFMVEGCHVPYVIEKIIDDKDLKIKLKYIDGPEQTFPLMQTEMFLAEEQISEGFTIPLDEEKQKTLLDYSIEYGAGSLAKILDVKEYPQQIMLFLEIDGEEKMIPWVEDWVVSQDDVSNVIQMKIPDGLL